MKLNKILKILCFVLCCFALGGGIFLLASSVTRENIEIDDTTEASNFECIIYSRIYKNGGYTDYTAWDGGSTRAPVNNGTLFDVEWYEDENDNPKDFGSTAYGDTRTSTSTSLNNTCNLYMYYDNGWTLVRRHARIIIKYHPNMSAGNYVYVGTSNSASFNSYSAATTYTYYKYDSSVTSSRTGWSAKAVMSGTTYVGYRYCYGITYNGNGNTGGTVPDSQTWLSGTNVTLSSSYPTRTGYDFLGWSTSSSATSASFIKGNNYNESNFGDNATTTLYAVWAPHTYKIVYNKNSTSATGSMSDQTGLKYGTTYSLTSNGYTRTGYDFAGWATSTLGNVVYSNGASVSNLTSTNNGTVNLYAKWTAKSYTLTLNRQNGSGGTSSATIYYDDYYPSSITKPTRTGYTFQGYYTSTNGGGTQRYNSSGNRVNSVLTTGSVTLYAYWTANPYTLTLDRQSGTGGDTSKTIYYDSYYPSSITKPTRTGYTFQGYYTSTNGNGTQRYNSSGNRVNSVYTTGNVTLYAYWTINSHLVTLTRGTGISSVSGAGTYNYGTSRTVSCIVSAGYHFTGWSGTYSSSSTSIYNARSKCKHDGKCSSKYIHSSIPWEWEHKWKHSKSKFYIWDS